MTEIVLQVEGLTVAYGKVTAVEDVSLQVPAGAVVGLIGANGAGKTTILLTVSGILRPDKGRIVADGHEIQRWPPHRVVDAGVIHVPEGRAVLAQMTVRENLEMGGYRRRDRAALSKDISGLMERFPILAERQHLPAGALSGGEQQILALARGLVARPKVLLLDEPSMGLAPQRVQEVFAILRQIHSEGVTILLVEQNARQALAISDYAYVLEAGRVTMEGTGQTLLHDPSVVDAYLGKAATAPSRDTSDQQAPP